MSTHAWYVLGLNRSFVEILLMSHFHHQISIDLCEFLATTLLSINRIYDHFVSHSTIFILFLSVLFSLVTSFLL